MFSFWKQPEDNSPDAKLSKDDLKQMMQHQHEEERIDKSSLHLWQPDSENKQQQDKDDEETADELEQMYQQALNTIEAVEQEAGLLSSDEVVDEGVDEFPSDAVQENPQSSINSNSAEESPKAIVERVTPEQILEAALFVGGTSLTTKKLRFLLQDEFDNDFIESAITNLNQRYCRENRPYEILFGEGGYRMSLRQEYERVRIRTFGMGPKEVKLSQEALEVLAVVAYKQPISKSEIEALGKQKPNGTLRQLLRREIISLERHENNPKEIKYSTTSRFLQLFGLKNISELPTAESLEFK